jgi:hypothetical protein
MIHSRLRSGVYAAIIAALLPALPESPAQPQPKEKPTIRLARAGEVKIDDLWFEDAAVIGEDAVVLVGTTSDEAELSLERGAPNGAIVDLAKKAARKFTNGHTARIHSVSVSRGRVATTSSHHDPVLRVWDLKAGKSAAEVKIEGPVAVHPKFYGVACFHKSDRVAVAAGERVIVLDPARPGDRTEFTFPPGVRGSVSHPVVVSPDDDWVACTSGGRELATWEIATRKGAVVSLIPEKAEEPERWYSGGVAFGPRGELIAWRHGPDEVPEGKAEKDVPAELRGVVRIDLPGGKVVPLGIGHTVHTASCAIDPTGTWLATAGSSWRDKPRADGANVVGELRVYHLPTKELAFREQVEGPPLVWVAVTPGGKRVVTTTAYGVVRWWDVQGK